MPEQHLTSLKPGDRVVHVADEFQRAGTVTGVTAEGHVGVKWDDDWQWIYPHDVLASVSDA